MEEFGKRFRASAPESGDDFWQRVDESLSGDGAPPALQIVDSGDTSSDLNSPTYMNIRDYPRKSFTLSAAAGIIALLAAGGVIWAVSTSGDDAASVVDSTSDGSNSQAVVGDDTSTPTNPVDDSDTSVPTTGDGDTNDVGTDDETEAEPETTTTSTTEPDTTSSTSTTQNTASALNPASFQSPSGNIHCAMSEQEATCAYIGQAGWERGGALDWLDGGEGVDPNEPAPSAGCTAADLVGMTVHNEPSNTPVEGRRLEESVRPLCDDDSSVAAEPSATLAYGDKSTIGVFTCESATSGVACRNNETSKGFVVSRSEISLLLTAGEGWKKTASEQARALQADVPQPRDVTRELLDEQGIEGGLVGMQAGGAACFLRPPVPDLFEPTVHCNSGVGETWNPRICIDGDLDGFWLGTQGAPMPSCVTDAWLFGAERQPVEAGEVWRLPGGLRCGTQDGNSIVCWNSDGNGIQTSAGELSIFFDAFG